MLSPAQLVAALRRRLRARQPARRRVELGLPGFVRRQFPGETELAWQVTQEAIAGIEDRDFAALASHSPALLGYDWRAYLACSVARMVRVLRALRAHVAPGGRVLDLGSYFGNFAVLAARAGYEVEARDSYGRYGGVFDEQLRWQRAAGVRVIDHDGGEARPAYDAVLLLGVLEHVPHTPRGLLEFVDASLRPRGVLVLDTPNLAYLYNRERLARGESIFCPIELQYGTELPFEGHHREYTVDELRFMLGTLGHELLELETFNYSLLAKDWVEGDEAAAWRRMEADPSLREVIFSVSRRADRRPDKP